MTEQEKKDKIEELKEHISDSEKGREVATQRFDAIILAIGTLAIGYIANYLKDYVVKYPNANIRDAQLAQLLLLVSVLANLVSQVASLFTHRSNAWFSRYRLRKLTGQLEKWSDKKYNRRIRLKKSQSVFWDKLNSFLNTIAFVLLIAGIIMFLRFTNSL